MCSINTRARARGILTQLLGIVDYSRRRSARFKLGAHFLLALSKSFNLLLLLCICCFLLFDHRFQLRNCCSLLLHGAVLFQELIQ